MPEPGSADGVELVHMYGGHTYCKFQTAEGVELVPIYGGHSWQFQTPEECEDVPMSLEELMGRSVANYLKGYGMNDIQASEF